MKWVLDAVLVLAGFLRRGPRRPPAKIEQREDFGHDLAPWG